MFGSKKLNAGSVEVTFSTKYDSSGLKKFTKDIDKTKGKFGDLDNSADKFHSDENKRWSKTSRSYGAADKQMGRLQKTSGRLKSALGTGLKVGAAAGAAAIGTGLVMSLKTAIVEAREAAKVTRQTEAVIKSTGGVAKITAKELEDLSTSISNKTAIDDEQIQSAGNLLLTFKNIRNEAGKGNDIFNQTTMAVADLSVAMGQDFKSSSIQLGKALNDPIKGLSALRRVGIQFTAQQEEQIKKMVESGNVMGAQKMILKELNSQFGGSAAAAADPIQRMQVIFKNFLEDVGGYLLPFLNKAADAVAKFVNEMMTGKGAGGDFVNTLKSIAEIAKNLWPTIRSIGSALFSVVRAFSSLPAPIQIAIGALGGMLALSVKLFGIVKVFAVLKKAAMAFFTFLRIAPAMAGPVGLAIAGIAVAAFLIIKNWDKVKKFLGKTFEWLKGAFTKVKDFVIDAAKKGFLGPTIWIIANWDKVVAFFRKLPDRIRTMISKVGGFLLKPFKWAADRISTVFNTVVDTIKWVIKTAKKAINLAEEAKEKVKGAPGSVKDWVGGKISDVGGWVGLASGGIAQPGEMAFVGDSSKPEFVISQTGPRKENINILAMAAEALGIPGFKNGGITKGKKAYRQKLQKGVKQRAQADAANELLDQRYQLEDRKARMDGTLDASEAGVLRALIDRKIKNLQRKRNSFGLSRFDKKMIDFEIQNLILDKQDLVAEVNQAATEATSGMADRISSFNAERFAVLASFGGNIRSRSGAMASMRPSGSIGGTISQGSSTTTNNAGKQITINQEFKERPEDPHVWTRNVQNEITALI